MSKTLRVLFVILLAAPAIAQDGAVSLDHVNGMYHTGIPPETEVSFYFRLTNYTDNRYAPQNAFRLWSPDGAVWSYPWRDTVWVDHNFSNQFSSFFVFVSAEGLDSDTIGFYGSQLSEGGGMPAGYDGAPFGINVIARSEDTGRHICIDSSHNPSPGGRWVWGKMGFWPDIIPAWDGPHCFTITDKCCMGERTGNVDYDPEDIVDLGDLTALIDFLFISFTEPPCTSEANIDGDPEGIIDLGDLTALIDYLFISFTLPAECP